MGWSERKIARHLRVSRPSVNKYLTNPDLSPVKRAPRPSKLDAYRDLIKEFVEDDPQVKAPVVLQRLQDKGFDGKITIVRDYLQKLRGRQSTASHKEQVKKLKRKLWLDKDISAFSSLGSEAVAYLEALARTRQPIKKNVSKLLCLKDDYGPVKL